MSLKEKDTKSVVISLGGSLIVPDEIDTGFVGEFVSFVKERVSLGERLVLITGGGKICRKYQSAIKTLGIDSNIESDWIGIHTTRLNGQFLRIVLGDLAHEELIIDPKDVKDVSRPVAVAAGWKPGWSTDFDAVEMAKIVGAKKLINLSNIDYVYDKDPKKFSDAKKIENISWQEFRKIIPEEWQPGLNSPFDPMAAKNADTAKIEVAIMNGKNINNLRNYLEGKKFLGTRIS